MVFVNNFISVIQSQLNGISHYEWAVGTKPGMENVQTFTQDGIVFGSKTVQSGPGMHIMANIPLQWEK